jgi:predicted RNA-binding protein with PUA-like domain
VAPLLSGWFGAQIAPGCPQRVARRIRPMNHWLMKSEPESFGVEHLARAPRRRARWDGVRNYQARNLLRDEMRRGDLAFFYHSSCDEPGIYGIVRIARAGYPDPSAFERGNHYYDPESDPAAPRWYAVDVTLQRRLAQPITLETLKREARALGKFALLQRGNRLSVLPVSARQWQQILALE